MAAASLQDPFVHFLNERRNIVNDIKQFLSGVLHYCKSITCMIQKKRPTEAVVARVTDRMNKDLHSIIKSLSLLHGLYGYPKYSSEDGTNISMDKGTLRNLVNEIKEKVGIDLLDYCPDAAIDAFWQFNFTDDVTSLENLPREPAHVFLKMARNILGNTERAGTTSRSILEHLPDLNKLKPTVWAEHEEKKECFGVSLGVRSYVRSLYLYIKLSQLRQRKDEDTGVKLHNLKAFKHLKSRKLNVKTDYKKYIDPCLSCKIFFDPASFDDRQTRQGSFFIFGNCAEYDVIRTKNLDFLLASPDEALLWNDVKSACKQQFEAFEELTRKLDPDEDTSRNDILPTYYTKKHEAQTKILRYKPDPHLWGYKLHAETWPPCTI